MPLRTPKKPRGFSDRRTTARPSEGEFSLSSEAEIGGAYREPSTAKSYVAQRFTSELMRLLHDRQVAAVMHVMRSVRPRNTLEIAPGPGRVTREIVPAGELTCLEYNKSMIDEARQACPSGLRWVQGNAFELPFEGEAFDFAYSLRFIRHFRRADRDRLYEQIRRVLRAGGTFLCDAVNATVSRPLREASPDDYPVYDKLYENERELREELANAGFELTQLTPVQRWFTLQSRVQVLVGPRSTRLCRWAIRGLEQLRRGPALEWIATCQRSD